MYVTIIKTYLIVQVYYGKILCQESPDRIIITNFTHKKKKAAVPLRMKTYRNIPYFLVV